MSYTTHARPNHRTWHAVLLASLAVATLGASAVLGQTSGTVGSSPSPGAPIASPETSVTSPPVAPGEPNPPFEDGALTVEPDPNLFNVRQQSWDHILVAPDGRTITVYFYNGVPECYGLSRVDVTQADGQVNVAVFTGTVPGDRICIELAQLYKVVIVLDAPIVLGGII